MTVRSKVVVLVFASFLLVVLILSFYSVPEVSAMLVKATSCTPFRGEGTGHHFIECCQTTSDTQSGEVVDNVCTICDDTNPPSNCGPPFKAHIFPPGTLPVPPASAGAEQPPPGNNTVVLPPGSIIKVPPGTTNALPPSGNNTGNATNPGNNTGTIIKVPPGLFKPTRNLTNAQPTGNNTGTPPPTLLAKQPSGHHHHKGGQTSTSSGNTNSTGH